MSNPSGPSTRHVHPFYCSVCSLPTEYCEFGPSVSKCKTWLKEKDDDEYEKIWGEGALAAKIGTLSLDKQEKIEADAAKLEKKAAKKAEAESKKKESTKVIIKRSERTKRKHQTHIQNLELFGVDLKKAAKQFAGKFATGSSVSKNPQGEEEIVIQGDVGDDIVEMIRAGAGALKGVPVDQITRVEVKKKKVEEDAPVA
ncbi:translation machinery-associated protein 22 [Cryptococcus amylolentus CBS 6039]|uniref:Translation machinery-associated protein 22 n=2 Tax=Cryptococcus amylolentus TaxID=104669 RepID=A0A1E3HPR5_9TREE|nr:translation machinery-associated protein 22 [Cryptococcus amylolentus CBS 6039]ODN78363.1 translation machinery-associated protein 22 [Cryptococcus amylolentus CBS 6039]ODO07040.1 translation machinery-associated protein 22 [Cryptococcus amylolentus CBS 6273]